MSFGAAESKTTTSIMSQWNALISYAVNQKHITIVASSGDNGAYDGTSSLTVNFPIFDPYVLSVGGTTLNISNNQWASESTWSGSGGGLSSYFKEPSYQSSVSLVSYSSLKLRSLLLVSNSTREWSFIEPQRLAG